MLFHVFSRLVNEWWWNALLWTLKKCFVDNGKWWNILRELKSVKPFYFAIHKVTTGKEWRRPELNCAVPAHDQSEDERRGGQKANQLVATGYQCIKKGDSGGEETSLLCMATAGTIMHFVYWVPREERLNGWVERWDRGPHYGLHFGVRTPFCSGSVFEQGEQVVTLVALFLGKGRVEGRTHITGHVQRPGVGTEWCHTHTHTYTKPLSKGVANLLDSQPVCWAAMQFQTFVMTD